MKAKDRFNEILERSRETNAYWIEKAIVECTEEMIARMEAGGVSRTELARRLGKNPAFITKLLRGDNNFTFETAVKIARALEMDFVPHLRPQGWETRWLDYSPTKNQESAVPLVLKKQDYTRETTIESTGVENETLALTA